ncbi:MAG TPA: hypothetical protein VEN30_00845 [Paraburkholderia sp.]|nr:hypothetical protein [Paraburkholderia sp.]
MFTFIVVVALAAFIPYVAAPAEGSDAANRVVSGRTDNEASV